MAHALIMGIGGRMAVIHNERVEIKERKFECPYCQKQTTHRTPMARDRTTGCWKSAACLTTKTW